MVVIPLLLSSLTLISVSFFEVRLGSTLSFSDVSKFELDENLYPMRMYADVKFTPKIMVVQISNVLRFIRDSFFSSTFELKLTGADAFLSLSDFFSASRI